MKASQFLCFFLLTILERGFTDKSDSPDCDYDANVIFKVKENIPTKETDCYKTVCIDGKLSKSSKYCAVLGDCYPEGSTYFLYGCTQHVCKQVQSSDGFVMRSVPTAQYCMDYYGNCRSSSEFFPWEMSQKVYKYCRCEVSGMRVTTFQCFGNPFLDFSNG